MTYIVIFTMLLLDGKEVDEFFLNKPSSVETLVDVANALDVSADYILADCINTHENVCENEFAEQIKECTLHESRIIIDMVKALREILRENAFTKRNSK